MYNAAGRTNDDAFLVPEKSPRMMPHPKIRIEAQENNNQTGPGPEMDFWIFGLFPCKRVNYR